jgi:hypothetical protein
MFLSSARLVLIVSSLLAAVSNAVPQGKPVKQKVEDPTVHLVKVLLHQQSTGFSDGRLEKYSERLGDRVSTALLKIFKAKELEDPENIKTFLPIIRSAFLYPTLVPAQYRKPKVTLRLLDRLQRKVADGELKHQLSEVATFVTEQTRPKQGIPP